MKKIIIEYRELKDLPKNEQIKIIEKYIINGYYFDYTDSRIFDLYVYLTQNNFDFFNSDIEIRKQWIINNPITDKVINCICDYESDQNKNEKILDSMVYFHKS